MARLCDAGSWGHGLFTLVGTDEAEHRIFMAAVATQGLSADISKQGARELVDNARAYMAMRDIPWQKWLSTVHRDDILKAYKAEWDALLSTVLRELEHGDAELRQGRQVRDWRQMSCSSTNAWAASKCGR